VGEFADGGRFAYPIDSYDHDNQGCCAGGGQEIFVIGGIIFSEDLDDFIAKDIAEFAGIEVFIFSHTSFDAFNYFDGCI